jgi:DNA-binding response OmpR family regulator
VQLGSAAGGEPELTEDAAVLGRSQVQVAPVGGQLVVGQAAVGTLVLDPARRVVARGGVPVALTAREYGLLLYLMRHAGDVVSKAQILDNVWDSAYEGGDNIVEVYVGYLRKKLDAPFNLNTLRTVRGLGYRLDADVHEAHDPTNVAAPLRGSGKSGDDGQPDGHREHQP